MPFQVASKHVQRPKVGKGSKRHGHSDVKGFTSGVFAAPHAACRANYALQPWTRFATAEDPVLQMLYGQDIQDIDHFPAKKGMVITRSKGAL